MLIAEGYDVKLGIFDIETMLELFDIGVYDPDTGEWVEYQISAYNNDLYKFVKFYTEQKYDYWVSFNGLDFDHQCLQFILENYKDWFDKTNLEITRMISDFAGKIIDDGKYDIRMPYNESQFPVKAIDLFKIHHFDNKQKRTSLKYCEFMMNMDVEEMPVHMHKEDLTPEEVQMTINYRRHDVFATLGFLYVTLGWIDKLEELVSQMNGFATSVDELKDFQDANKIQARLDIMKETGMRCLNWSDVKIGEEMNLMKYMKVMNLKNAWDLHPKKITQPYGQKMKNFFPPTMEFQTEHMKKFILELGEEKVKAKVKGKKPQEFKVKIGSSTYTIAKGGIHSNESDRFILTTKGYKLKDADVGAQYPCAILKFGVYPPHLDELILEQFQETVELKDHYKARGKAAKAALDESLARLLKSLEGLTKLQMNGGFYGKMGQPGSFLEYPEGVLKVTIGNQIEILMLVEALEMAGFKVVSANTDGIVTYFPENREKEYLEICEKWEQKVGNVKLGKLEYADFDGLWQESVNSYIGKLSDGTVKKKGAFVTTYGKPGVEMNKNKSKRIIPLALEQYFIHGKDPISFIQNHKNVFDFCIVKKAARDLYYEELIGEDSIIHKKLIRYYVCNQGNIIKKRGLTQKGLPMNNHCEAMDKDYPWTGQPLVRYFNSIKKSDKFSDYDINYNYYILQTLKKIDKIEKSKKARNFAERFKPQQQSALF